MAGTHVVKNFWRSRVAELDVNGNTVGDTDDDALTVQVERYSGSLEIVAVRLPFADYAGLEAEFEAGTATTVLTSSLNTHLAALTWPADSKTASQRAYIDTEITIA